LDSWTVGQLARLPETIKETQNSIKEGEPEDRRKQV
jgi:hypothetical protein